MNASELELDEIGLGVDNASISLLATGSLSIEIDLDADDDGEWFENATDVELSASVESIGVSVPNVGASSSFMGLAVVETSLSDTTLDSADIVATYRNATTDVGLDLEFSLDANDDFPFEFVDVNDVIKVKGPENGEFSVNMPSLQPKQGIGNFSLEHIFDNKVDFSQIPFIHNCDYEEVKISDIVGNLQEYWAKKVSSKKVFTAGDVYQNIFEEQTKETLNVDISLSKCYRTDPRTLMFAHAVGMGLFEKQKLNWIYDDILKPTGYTKNVVGDMVLFSRQPLTRFDEEIPVDDVSVEIKNSISLDSIFSIIDSIQEKYSGVAPKDIANCCVFTRV